MLFQFFIRKKLSKIRYIHSVNVAREAEKLAEKFGANKEKAKIAGILHDITKEWTDDQHMRFVKKYKIRLSKYETASKKTLLHAITGSYYAKFVLGIKDGDIIRAIRFHTTARKGMSVLEKIIYVADFISKDRNFEGVDKLRTLAETGINPAVIGGLSYSMRELVREKRLVHPNTSKAYNEMIFSKKADVNNLELVPIDLNTQV